MKTIFFPAIIFFFYYSCTSNPFWDDGTKLEENVSGKIIPENMISNTRTFVWLEGHNIHTYTNGEGEFKIVLNTSSDKISGPLNIYFFIHNYLLDSVTVNFTNGRLSSNQSHIDSNGNLLEIVYLKKILSCSSMLQTELNILESEKPSIEYSIKVHKPADISIYKFQMGDSINSNSGLIFHNNDDASLTLHRFSMVNEDGFLIRDQFFPHSFEISEELTWTYLIDSNQLSLSAGEYDVYPYFKIEHQYLPIGLVEALGGTAVFEFNEYYLDLSSDVQAARLFIN